MSSRKETILELIDKYSRKSILNGSLDFSECSAYTIALDLQIDRTNISRILNQLHKEGLLIKITGRPTLYISNKAISDNFPYAVLPSTISSKESIDTFLLQPESSSKMYANINMIGSEKNGSLYNSVIQILPIIFYPFQSPQIFTLRGQQGVGKHYFLEQLLNRGKSIGRFRKNQFILQINGNNLLRTYALEVDKLKQKNYGIIAITIMDTLATDIIVSFINQIYYFSNFQNSNPPLIALLIDESVKNYSPYYELTPFNAYFPPLSDRPLKENLKLILAIISEECMHLSRRVQISKKLLLALLNTNYTSNIRQLKNNIIYAFTFSAFHSTHHSNVPLVLSEKLFPEAHSNETIPSNERELITSLPEIITFDPIHPINLDELLGTTLISKSSFIDQTKPKKTESLKEHLLSLSTNFDFKDFPACNSTLKARLTTIFENTPLIYDTILFEYVLSLIEQIALGNINTKAYTLEDFDTIMNPNEQNICNKTIQIIISRYSLPGKEILDYITGTILTAFQCVSDLNYPIIFITHGNELANHYALQLNRFYGKRLFFSKNFTTKTAQTGLPKFIKNLSANIKSLNSKHGVFLFVDSSSLTKLDSKLFFETQSLTFSIYPSSIIYINEAMDIIKNANTSSIIPLSSKILQIKGQYHQYLNSKTLNTKNNRLNDSHLRWVRHLFSSLNSKMTTEILYQLLIEVCNNYSYQPTNQLIIDFIFYGNCILERISKKDMTQYVINDLYYDHESPLFQTLKEKIAQSKELTSFHFTENDLVVLYDCLVQHLS